MWLKQLTLTNFRSHERTEIAFDPKVNLIVGPNGSGKTNLLEAIHYLCLSKSFLTSNDDVALRFSAPHFEIDGSFGRDSGIDMSVRLAYVPGQGKRLHVNGSRLERLTEIVGRVPVVVLAPANHEITAGAPEARRTFIDNILCQSKPAYLSSLLSYRKALKQRNRLLFAANGNPDEAQLAAWTHELITSGCTLITERVGFTERFQGYLQAAHGQLSGETESPGIAYRSTIESTTDGGVDSDFSVAVHRSRAQERRRRRTVVGPHRDDMDFYLDDMPLRRYGSQGQHRTFAMALKLAQYQFIFDEVGERPVLLLDDAFDNLDRERSAAFAGLLGSDFIGQSITTAPEADALGQIAGSNINVVDVGSGRVKERQQIGRVVS